MKENTTIIPSLPTDYFEDIEWENITSRLRQHEACFYKAARASRSKFISSSKWPELCLKKRRFLEVKILKLSLQRNYLHDKRIFWEVYRETVSSIWVFNYKLKNSMHLMIISDEEINDVDFICSEIIKYAKA